MDMKDEWTSAAEIRRDIASGEQAPPRCKASHNPGVWPYTARCVRPAGHETNGDEWAVRDNPRDADSARLAEPTEHYDKHGKIWESYYCQLNPAELCDDNCSCDRAGEV